MVRITIGKRKENPPEIYEDWLMRLVEKDPEMIMYTTTLSEWEEYLSKVGLRHGKPPTIKQMSALWLAITERTPKGFDIPLHRKIGVRMVRQFIRGKWTIRWFGYPEKRFIKTEDALSRIEEARRLGMLPRKWGI